ncbi:transposase [Streptomyces atroolivaceus]|uniref:transposase n=1 Tax=Streptomyces atroolivaceus TaxID=66869 RepID=UPI0034475E9F
MTAWTSCSSTRTRDLRRHRSRRDRPGDHPASTRQDIDALDRIYRGLTAQGFQPAEHVVDSDCISPDSIHHAAQQWDITLFGPVRDDPQAGKRPGFAKQDFHIAWQARTLTCPNGVTSPPWKPTLGDGHPRLAIRAGCEATVSETVHAHGLRNCRYRGMARTHVQHVLTAAGTNIIRSANTSHRASHHSEDPGPGAASDNVAEPPHLRSPTASGMCVRTRFW